MPQIKKGPKALNTLLEKAYQSLLEKYDEKKASVLSWLAAKTAGWRKKDERWVRASDAKWSSLTISLDDKEYILPIPEEQNGEELVELCLSEPSFDSDGNIIVEEKVNAEITGVAILGGGASPYHKTLPELTAANIIRLSETPHFSKIMFVADYDPPRDPDKLVLELEGKYVKLESVPLIPEDQLTHDLPLDIDGMIKNFDQSSKKLIPQLNLGHSDRMKNESDYPSFGRMVRLFAKRIKDTTGKWVRMLMADFEDVPEVIANLIENKSYTRISAELYPFFPLKDAGIKLSDLKPIIVNGKEEKTMPEDYKIPEEVKLLLKDKDNLIISTYFDKLEKEKKETADKLLALSDKFTAFEKEKVLANKTLEDTKSENKKLSAENDKIKLSLADQERSVHTVDLKKRIADSLKPSKDRPGYSPAIASKIEDLTLKATGLIKLSEADKDIGDMIIDLHDTILKDVGTSIIRFGDTSGGTDHEGQREPGAGGDGTTDKRYVDLQAKRQKMKNLSLKLSELSGKKITSSEAMLIYGKIESGEYTEEQIAERLKNNLQI